ncbi:uncharacterized protein [Diadema setosum]|uniref:uncharacterized protein n=1 Tax=Diadema setosum TaxID=31175 RepID=UPI003B3B1C42
MSVEVQAAMEDDKSQLTACFLSESKAVGERLLAHNASDKDQKAVAHFLYHTGAVSIQVQSAVEENKSKITGFAPASKDSRQRISTGVDVKIETKDDNPGVTVQSSVEYPTNPPGASMRDGSGAMDDDASDDNGYALWDQDLLSEEEATPQENAEGEDRTDKGQECQSCHAWFRHTWDWDIHRLQCPAQRVPSVFACNHCGHIRKKRESMITHLQKAHNFPFGEILAKLQDLKIPLSDIPYKKSQIYTVRKSGRREQMKTYACDHCDFTHKGQKPIIRHLQEEHELTLAETLSKYRELEVHGKKDKTSKRRSKRALKSRKLDRLGKKRNIKNANKRKTARSSRNCGRNSPSSTSQLEECTDMDILMDLTWKDTIQHHETATDEKDDCGRVPREKINLRTLSIKLQDIRKTNGDTTFEANSQMEESAGEAVGHTADIALSTTEHGDVNKEMEAKLEESEDKEQAQASEESDDMEKAQAREESEDRKQAQASEEGEDMEKAQASEESEDRKQAQASEEGEDRKQAQPNEESEDGEQVQASEESEDRKQAHPNEESEDGEQYLW